ncbi:MAG: hypothetical protein HUK22_03600 [Thermoguttaceae bacterium]|nr:hypothetical protein [Thermoguttaceae bacterium]
MGKKYEPLEKSTGSLFDALPSAAPVSSGEAMGDELIVKRVSVWAILSALAGAISLLTILHAGFLAFSAIGVLAAIWSLAMAARSGGELGGKRFALAGLALAIVGAVAGPTRTAVYRAEFCRQADEFCRMWFDAALKGDMLTLKQYESSAWARRVILNDAEELGFWRGFLGEEERHFALHQFEMSPTLRTLVALGKLGDKVRVTHYKTMHVTLKPETEWTIQVYAITADLPQGRQTFFIRLAADRTFRVTEEGEKMVSWVIRNDSWTPADLDEDGRPTFGDN